MTNSREKFEAWFYEPEVFSFRGDRIIGSFDFDNAMYEAFKAGRESMRDEAVEKCAVSSSYRAIEHITKAIKEIQP